MAICQACNDEMTDLMIITCRANVWVEYPDGERLQSIAYQGATFAEKCHSCGVRRGGKHHPGCTLEICPRCKGQLISCGCFDEEEVENGMEE